MLDRKATHQASAHFRRPTGDGADDGTSARESRTRLLDLPVGSVDDYRLNRHEKSPEAFTDAYKVCFPYKGVCVWHVGKDSVVADANQVLFVRGGEGFRVSGPVGGGYADLIITPGIETLSEIVGAHERRLFDHPLFRTRCSLASPLLQSFRTQFLHWAMSDLSACDLEAEEMVIGLLRTAVQRTYDTEPCGAATARLIKRAKCYLEAHLADRIRLVDIGRAVGASAAYLTVIFHKFEGVSLHQYLTQLRLARALAELPHTDNLTALALDTGFSSHSHFTAAFRRAFGSTPSHFRTSMRSRVPPVRLAV